MSDSSEDLRLLSSATEAAAVLAAGGLVGLPTETVYGLAADAHNRAAIRRVYEVKGRPGDHPVIVHLADAADLDDWAATVPPQLREFADRRWPGPLTIIVPKQPWVPLEITGGMDSVAIRVPGALLAREVISALGAQQGRPAAVVAPSANLFGQVSPTTAAHVREGLAGRLRPDDAVLDGGPCLVGVESTIVAWIDGRLTVLRPGAVTLEPESRSNSSKPGSSGDQTGSAAPQPPPAGIRAPGTLPAHYAPRARVILATRPTDADIAASPTAPVGLLAPAEFPTPAGWTRLAAPSDDREYAESLYASLRAADTAGMATIIAVPPAAGSLRAAIVDRLSRAARGSRSPVPKSPVLGPDRPR
jgi:L-threonylcarbamoyladenylate synthase